MGAGWNLADLFEGVVDRLADAEAVVSGDHRLTYRALDDRADRLAHVLAERGVGPGDRVALALRNGHEHLEAILAAHKLGAVPFNVNYRYTAAEMAYLFDDASPRAVLHGPDLGDAVGPAVERRRAAGDTVDVLVGRGPEHEARLAAAPSGRPDPAARAGQDLYLLYTGGTTGMPKGVEWRHEDIVRAALGKGGEARLDGGPGEAPSSPEDLIGAAGRSRSRVLPASPLIHGTAQWVALGTLLAGGTVVLLPSSTFEAHELLDLAARERVSVLVIVGDAFGRPIADALAAEPDRWDLGALVAVVSGGAVLSPTVREQIGDLLPWAVVVDGYGTSETGGQGNAVWWPGRRAAPTTRFPLGSDTAVLDEEGTPLVPGVDTGRIGMIARRGHIPQGYRNDPVRTAETFPTIGGVRWAVPGDLGRIEADGTVTLLGRGASSINTGGEKVFPDEVEAVLKGHPSVFDAAVVGVEDPVWGERVTAVVSLRPGAVLDEPALDAHCRAHLAAFKVPRRVVEVDAVRRLPSGKTDHAWVRSAARAGGDAPTPAGAVAAASPTEPTPT